MSSEIVIPAESKMARSANAEIQISPLADGSVSWTPAFAGVTKEV